MPRGSCAHRRDRKKDTCSSRNMVGADSEACWEGKEQVHTRLLSWSFLSILRREASGSPGYERGLCTPFSHIIYSASCCANGMQMLILYCLLNSNEENVSVHMDFFFLNNFDPMLPESMDSGC